MKKHTKLLLTVVGLAVLAAVIAVALIPDKGKEVAFKDFGYCFVNTGRLTGIMRVGGEEADISDLVNIISPDDTIVTDGEKVTYKGEKISSELPLFFDDSSYIYIPWEKAIFLTEDLKIRSVEGNAFLIKKGFFGDDYTLRDSADDLLMLSCTRNLFLALKSFKVTAMGESFTVDPMELVLFDGYSIRTASVSETVAKRSSHGITKDSLVTIDGRTYFMSDFLEVLGLSVERDSTKGGLERIDDSALEELEEKNVVVQNIEDNMITIPEETFQYFLGHRYELPENLEVYQNGGIWYKKGGDVASPLESIPLYGEEYIYFPADFGIVDPGARRQHSVPAFSRIKREKTDDGYYLYPNGKDEGKLLPQAVIYDGAENYLFTDYVTIKWKNSSFTLAPLSYACYDGVDRLEFYDTGEDRFYSYILDVDSIVAEFDTGHGVDLVSKMIRIDGKPMMIVVSEPGMYGSYFD